MRRAVESVFGKDAVEDPAPFQRVGIIVMSADHPDLPAAAIPDQVFQAFPDAGLIFKRNANIAVNSRGDHHTGNPVKLLQKTADPIRRGKAADAVRSNNQSVKTALLNV